MDGTILQQGSFIVASGVPAVNIVIPGNADYIKVSNFTRKAIAGQSSTPFYGIEYYWQLGYPAGYAELTYYNNVSSTNYICGDAIASGGFTPYNPTLNSGVLPQYGANIAITTGATAVTNATRPVVTTTNTTGLVAASTSTPGSVVRINAVGFPDNGIDFTVGAVIPGTSFTLLSAAGALATAPGAPGTSGTYQIQNFNALFYPRRRYIASISQATNAVVATTVPHGFTPGQAIRFEIPSASGMTQLNATSSNNYLYGIVVSISATDSNIFTINIDTTSFTAFTWPTSAQGASSFPTVVPFGEDTATSIASPTIQVPGVSSATLGQQIYNTQTGLLADATVNTGFLGMNLGTGAVGLALTGNTYTGPAGSVAADVMYWVAGKSTYGGL